MPRIVKEDIFWLQITVNHIETVQALESAKELGRVESCSIDIKALFSLKVMEELSTVDERQDEVEFFG